MNMNISDFVFLVKSVGCMGAAHHNWPEFKHLNGLKGGWLQKTKSGTS